MKKKYLILGIFYLFIILFIPAFVGTSYHLRFEPVLFVNEWYKFILNLVVILTSFTLIYQFWGNYQSKKLFSATKDILIGRLDISVAIIEECSQKLAEGNGHEIIRIISQKTKNITTLNKSLQQFLNNPLILNNKKIYFLLVTFLEKHEKFLEYLTNQKLINIDNDFKNSFTCLYNELITLKNNIEGINE